MNSLLARFNTVVLTLVFSSVGVSEINTPANLGNRNIAGGIHGGGGDASEMGVDQIRTDLLKWVINGGPSSLKMQRQDMTLETYVKKMTEILQPQFVVIGFVTTTQEKETNDPEMKVDVNGQPKQCRGFLSQKDQKPHILCNLDRYPKDGADQYRLIHHEYAGLVDVEKNDGSSSDYSFSNQLTNFLRPEVILRLSIAPVVTTSPQETKTKYQALSEMYESAPLMATIQDLNKNEKKQECQFFRPENPNTPNGLFHFQMFEKKTEGNSDPIFPVKPTSEWFAVFAGAYIDYGATSINAYMLNRNAAPYPAYLEKDLVVIQPYCAVESRIKEGDDRVCYQASTFLIRKTEKGLIFKKVSTSEKQVSFGYCFSN